LSHHQLEDLRSAFSLFDKDASGSIDIDELRACLRTLGRYPTPVELEVLMQQMDSDGNGTIEFGEFVAAMHEHQEVRPPPLPAAPHRRVSAGAAAAANGQRWPRRPACARDNAPQPPPPWCRLRSWRLRLRR
jgi:hypothetical protein